MSKDKKIVISTLVLSVILGATAYGINQTSAQGMEGRSSLIEKLTAKFNLNKDEVTKVFDEERTAQRKIMDTERKTRAEENLNSAVAKGELTEAKKQLVLTKLAELEKEREANWEKHQNLSVEERKNQMTSHRAELEKWASDNGIDIKYLVGGMGKGMGGEGMGRGMGNGGGGQGLRK